MDLQLSCSFSMLQQFIAVFKHTKNSKQFIKNSSVWEEQAHFNLWAWEWAIPMEVQTQMIMNQEVIQEIVNHKMPSKHFKVKENVQEIFENKFLMFSFNPLKLLILNIKVNKLQ